MTYSITRSGTKAEVLAAIAEQAAQQSLGAAERVYLDASVKSVTDVVNQYAGENDAVSVSASGHVSQSDTDLAMQHTFGVSIRKAAAGRTAGVSGQAALDAAREAASAASPSAIGGAPVGSTSPTGASVSDIAPLTPNAGTAGLPTNSNSTTGR